MVVDAQSSAGSGVVNGGKLVVRGGGKNSTGLRGGFEAAFGVTESTREPWLQMRELTVGQRFLRIGGGSTVTLTDAPGGNNSLGSARCGERRVADARRRGLCDRPLRQRNHDRPGGMSRLYRLAASPHRHQKLDPVIAEVFDR